MGWRDKSIRLSRWGLPLRCLWCLSTANHRPSRDDQSRYHTKEMQSSRVWEGGGAGYADQDQWTIVPGEEKSLISSEVSRR